MAIYIYIYVLYAQLSTSTSGSIEFWSGPATLGSLAISAVSWDGSGRYLLGKHLLTYFNWLIIIWLIYGYPPTPALAKAGAAPGTTAGVELLLLRFPRSNPSRSKQAAPRLLLRFPRSNPSRSQEAAPRPHRVNIFLACFVLH